MTHIDLCRWQAQSDAIPTQSAAKNDNLPIDGGSNANPCHRPQWRGQQQRILSPIEVKQRKCGHAAECSAQWSYRTWIKCNCRCINFIFVHSVHRINDVIAYSLAHDAMCLVGSKSGLFSMIDGTAGDE